MYFAFHECFFTRLPSFAEAVANPKDQSCHCRKNIHWNTIRSVRILYQVVLVCWFLHGTRRSIKLSVGYSDLEEGTLLKFIMNSILARKRLWKNIHWNSIHSLRVECPSALLNHCIGWFLHDSMRLIPRFDWNGISARKNAAEIQNELYPGLKTTVSDFMTFSKSIGILP